MVVVLWQALVDHLLENRHERRHEITLWVGVLLSIVKSHTRGNQSSQMEFTRRMVRAALEQQCYL